MNRTSILVTALTALALWRGAAPDREASASSDRFAATATTSTSVPAVSAPPVADLGDFPEFPAGGLPEPVASRLQNVLDSAHESHTIRGATAAVIVAGRGTWTGAVGSDISGNPLTTGSATPTASVGKTLTAAQVLRLAEDGELGLDDLAADYFPPELAAFDANQATIRHLLGMRSGLTDPVNYDALVEDADIANVVAALGHPYAPAGSMVVYANINYVLLGLVIEHVTGQPLAEAIQTGVLDRPDLDGLTYGVSDAFAADGWQIVADARSLARWGYELYGGFVLADVSLDQMLDFRGEFYGLGAIDFTDPDVVSGYDIPAVGHGGFETSHVVRLVAFPDAGVVVSVQANANSFEQVHDVVTGLVDATQHAT